MWAVRAALPQSSGLAFYWSKQTLGFLSAGPQATEQDHAGCKRGAFLHMYLVKKTVSQCMFALAECDNFPPFLPASDASAWSTENDRFAGARFCPPFRPASIASSGFIEKARFSFGTLFPPLLAISRRFSGLSEANPRLDPIRSPMLDSLLIQHRLAATLRERGAAKLVPSNAPKPVIRWQSANPTRLIYVEPVFWGWTTWSWRPVGRRCSGSAAQRPHRGRSPNRDQS